MKTGKAGIDLIKKWEGNGKNGKPFVAYICQAGKPTIGYGHTRTVSFSDVKNERKISPEQAEKLLESDLSEAERAVNNAVKVDINQNQFDALVSFTFNLGAYSLNSSTLIKLINQGKIKEAADQFIRWVYVKAVKDDGTTYHKVSDGLVNRRKDERDLYLKEDI